jgi:hypothetical protein
LNLFVARETQTVDVAELGKVRLHGLFLEPTRYAAEVDDARFGSLLKVSDATREEERLYCAYRRLFGFV